MVKERCEKPTECCYNESGFFTGCYDPSSCETCTGGAVKKNDPDSLILECKKCEKILSDPTDIYETKKTCKDWEDCCYGVCYNLNCEDCNPATKQKEPKCSKTGKECCKNNDGSISSCYNPKDCLRCEAFGDSAEVKPKPCKATSGELCCLKSGECYDPKCKDCDSSTGIVTDRCPGKECCINITGNFVGCFNPKKCQRCTNGAIVDTITQEQKANCIECDDTGATYLKCASDKCCNGTCFDIRCEQCVGGVLQDSGGCNSEDTCCGDECLPPSSCKGCSAFDNGTQIVTNNKCANNTDGNIACCNGVCVDPTCKKCSGTTIVTDNDKINDGNCCNGQKLDKDAGEQCCKSGNEYTRFKPPYLCCPEALGSNGVYNDQAQGCCPYGNIGNNTIYNKTSEDCCPTASSASKTFNKNYYQCCGTDIIDKIKKTCCNNEYGVIKNCEQCAKDSSGNPIKNYKEENCFECVDGSPSEEPAVKSKCRAEINNGKNLDCCDGTSTCYDPNSNICSTCDKKNSVFKPTCPKEGGDQSLTGCCDGNCYNPNEICGFVCYDTPNDEGAAQQRLTPKCPQQSWSKAFNQFFDVGSKKTQCCNNECIDPSCYACASDESIVPKCPGDDPNKVNCCPGAGCYGSCEKCLSYNDSNNNLQSKIVKVGQTIDKSTGNINGDDGSCKECCNNKCCEGVCCDNTCCGKDQICSGNHCCDEGTVWCGDRCCKECINGQCDCPAGQEKCGTTCCDIGNCCNGVCLGDSEECCDGIIINTTQEKCCIPTTGSNKFVCPIGERCCGDICCDQICCNNRDCCEVACCEGGSGGGCYNQNACQECTGGKVTPKCTKDQGCCDGACYNPKKCEECVSGVIKPFSPVDPLCYCVNGDTICDCDPTQCLEPNYKCINGRCVPKQNCGWFISINYVSGEINECYGFPYLLAGPKCLCSGEPDIDNGTRYPGGEGLGYDGEIIQRPYFKADCAGNCTLQGIGLFKEQSECYQKFAEILTDPPPGSCGTWSGSYGCYQTCIDNW